MIEAKYYEVTKDKVIKCKLCPRFCLISDRGACGVRKKIKNKLYSLVYGNPSAINVDPIEKKPLYHFYPKTKSLSIGTKGCNLKCGFCQNYFITQSQDIDVIKISPAKIVKLALRNNCQSISYTYNEPTVFYEYMLDIAKKAKENRIKNVFISNGYINKKPLERLCKYIDAANIDLKGFSKDFYEQNCGITDFHPILEALKILKKKKVHLEITNLIIPLKNDSKRELEDLCAWIKDNLGENTPVHFTRFFPNYKELNNVETSHRILKEAKDTAIKCGLRYVYIGNVIDETNQNTFCPNCKQTVITRKDNRTIRVDLKKNRCIYCKEKIEGKF